MHRAQGAGQGSARRLWHREAVRLWAGVLVLPPLAGAVSAVVAADSGCGDDDTALYLFAYSLVFPFGMLGLGVLAGRATWGGRGRIRSDLGAAAGGILAFVWALISYWPVLIVLGDAACP